MTIAPLLGAPSEHTLIELTRTLIGQTQILIELTRILIVLALIGVAVGLAHWLIPGEQVRAWAGRRLSRFRKTAEPDNARPMFVSVETATEVDTAFPITVAQRGTVVAGDGTAVLPTPAFIRGSLHGQGGLSAVLTAPSVIRGTVG